MTHGGKLAFYHTISLCLCLFLHLCVSLSLTHTHPQTCTKQCLALLNTVHLVPNHTTHSLLFYSQQNLIKTIGLTVTNFMSYKQVSPQSPRCTGQSNFSHTICMYTICYLMVKPFHNGSLIRATTCISPTEHLPSPNPQPVRT